jgi:hypothetical protein
MFSRDFFRLIAFDALRAGVQGRNQASRIQYVNCVITTPLDQQPELLLALLELLCRDFTLGNASRKLRFIWPSPYQITDYQCLS